MPFGERAGIWAFWLYNGGLVLWIALNFFPIGWAQLDAGGFAPPHAPKRRTPPLFIISIVLTGVAWVGLMAYVYKFAPRTRRFDFPHNQLTESMLNDENVIHTPTRVSNAAVAVRLLKALEVAA